VKPCTGHGELFCAPIGVEFPTTLEGVQPDNVFVSLARLGSEVGEIDLEEIFARD